MATNPATGDAYKKAVLKTDQIVKTQKEINARFYQFLLRANHWKSASVAL